MTTNASDREWMDTSFPSTYQCELLRETPNSSASHYYYPGASKLGGHDGLLARIRPDHGEQWIGTFQFDTVTPNAVTGVFTTPNPGRLCIVAHGGGYFVSASDPAQWEEVQATPVIEVCSVPSHGIIVFATYTDLVAYDATGIKWRTQRLSYSDLKIVGVTDKDILGEYWEVRLGKIGTFTVDLATGAHRHELEFRMP